MATPHTSWSCNPRTDRFAQPSACARPHRALHPRTRRNRSRNQTAPRLQSVPADARRHSQQLRALRMRNIRCRNISHPRWRHRPHIHQNEPPQKSRLLSQACRIRQELRSWQSPPAGSGQLSCRLASFSMLLPPLALFCSESRIACFLSWTIDFLLAAVQSATVDICKRCVLINPELLFRMGRRSDHNALPFCGPSLRDPDVKINDVQRFTPFTISMLWPSIPCWIITRVHAALAVKTKADSE